MKKMMDNWFTVGQIDKDTWMLSEYRYPEETHCYLLNGSGRSLLIDTGLGICNIYDEVRKLTDNPVTAVATHIQCDLPENYDIDTYTVFQGMSTRVLNDGDIIDIGGRRIQVLHTPGHSPGHMCFWEKEKGYLFTGHHSLDIQPEILIRMRNAFRRLKEEGELQHGSGTFDYEDWVVWL